MFQRLLPSLKIAILTVCLLIVCNAISVVLAKPIAQKGTLYLGDWDFVRSGPANLSGEWEIYWDRFIKPEDFATRQITPDYFMLPGTWEEYHKDNKASGHSGFATLRLKINTGSDHRSWMLSISNVLTSFKLYVNGALVAEVGDPESPGGGWVDQRHPLLISDKFSGSDLEIVLHLANYYQREGGIEQAMRLGPPRVIQEFQRETIGYELFLFGSILIIGIYHLGNFFFRKKDLASLYFSILCFLFSSRVLLMGSRFASLLFPGLGYYSSLVLEILSIYLAVPVFASFIYYLYPEEFSHKILKINIIVSLVLSVAVISYNETAYNITLYIFEAVAILTLMYIFVVLIRAIGKSRQGAKILMAGFVILFGSAVNDLLYERSLIDTGFFLPLGMLGYILFQALHLSYRFSHQFAKIEELTAQLAQANSTLEQRVIDRTEALKQSNEQLITEIAEHKHTAEELEQAKVLAESANHAKSEFLANMSHELRTPMHGILGFAKFGEEKIHKVAKETLLEFFTEIKMCGERLLILLNDLLDLSKLESGKIIYEFRNNDLSSVVDIVLKEFIPVASQKEVQIEFQSDRVDSEAIFDEGKLIQVVRNLVSNAIKFSPEQGKIDVKIENQGDNISLSVTDRGVGIPENELEDVFDKFVQSTKTKTVTGGTGLGLPISKKIIHDHKGDIWAVNNHHGGATLTFTIPKAQKPKKKLGEILVEQNLITEEELINTLKSQKEAN